MVDGRAQLTIPEIIAGNGEMDEMSSLLRLLPLCCPIAFLHVIILEKTMPSFTLSSNPLPTSMPYIAVWKTRVVRYPVSITDD